MLLLIICCLFSACNLTVAFGTTKTEQLHHVLHSITSLKHTISHNHRARSQLQKQLQINETTSGNLAKQLQETEHKLRYEQKILAQLHRDKLYYGNKLINQKHILAKEISASYILSRQPFTKILLNNEHPHKLNRMFTYYKYLEQARAKTINELNQTITKLQTNRKRTLQQTKKLHAIASKQKHELKHLDVLHHHHKLLLHEIDTHLKSQTSKLHELLANKKSLQLVIARLKAISVSFATPLNKLRHKLPWPTKGKIIDLFGRRIDHSQLHWNGILIKGLLGQRIQAIATGKVVFAQWLQGYGLLLIINHGHGYLSLYARNNSLYKKVGDIVHRGDLIATIGNSGGHKSPALYFSIRHNSNPVDPKKWCKK